MVTFFIKFLSIVILRSEQWKYQKLQGSIFSGSLIVKQTFMKPEFITIALPLAQSANYRH